MLGSKETREQMAVLRKCVGLSKTIADRDTVKMTHSPYLTLTHVCQWCGKNPFRKNILEMNDKIIKKTENHVKIQA